MISTLNSFGIRGLSAGSSYEGIKLTDTGSCYFEVNLSYGPFVGFVTTGNSGIYGTGDATNPYNLTLKFNGSEPTLSDSDLTGNDYFIVSDTSDSSLMKKVSASAILGLIPEENRYFYGPTAPTDSDLMLGDKWFNTTVGSEFTYLYTDEDQDTYIWVDIDHLGQGESGDIGIDLFANGSQFATDSPSLNISGGSFITVSSEGSNKYVVALNDPNNLNYVKISGDNMTGTLTGTNATFTNGITTPNGFIGTLTGTNASFTNLTASSGFVGTLTGTNASFTSLTASSGFVGTLTGTNIRYTNAEFGTESLVIQGSSATFTNMSVMITGDSTFDINDLSIGTTFSANNLNQSVYRIFADDGVALGGNTLSKNNWLGNNVFLTPQEDHSVMIGFPTSTPVDDSYAKLMVTGGIITKRIFSMGTYSGLTAFQNGVGFENIASAAAFGITSVDGYEHPLFSVQDTRDGGWVNAPKIRRVWPSGSTGARSRTDDFESNEYVTKSYVDNNTILRRSDANPSGQKWRFISIGFAGVSPDHLIDSGPHTYSVDGYRDLGFTGPMYIDVNIHWTGGSPVYMQQQKTRVISKVNFGSFDIIFDDFATDPTDIERIKIDTINKQVKINTGLPGLVYINITPSS
jgi:hypothetical protein